MTHVVPASVPTREHYSHSYLLGGRFFCYAHQMETALSFNPRTVLEVGAGAGIVAAALRAARIEVTTLDIQPDLGPDLIGTVTDIPASDRQFDVAMCCQVLEHLPFEDFASALSELKRVARLGVVLSLPDCTPHYYLGMRLPRCGPFLWCLSRRRSLPREERLAKWNESGHYWEIGFEGCGLRRILELIASVGLKVDRTWRVTENPYHRFFKLHTS